MKSVKYSSAYEEKASRIELLIRFVWMIPVGFVSFFLSIIYIFAYMLQFLHILVLGKRHKVLHDWIFKYMAYYTKFNSYFVLLTDERTPIMPED
ncbi:DUF4389 domain-containing protein [Candidatus Micrarchaeota archaeon]|nr:DUF4389 domain-containing protein [Candidatus Micrarchaeota archaeon]